MSISDSLGGDFDLEYVVRDSARNAVSDTVRNAFFVDSEYPRKEAPLRSHPDSIFSPGFGVSPGFKDSLHFAFKVSDNHSRSENALTYDVYADTVEGSKAFKISREKLTTKSDSSQVWTWDGTDSTGTFLEEGEYRIKVKVWDEAKNALTLVSNVVEIDTARPSLVDQKYDPFNNIYSLIFDDTIDIETFMSAFDTLSIQGAAWGDTVWTVKKEGTTDSVWVVKVDTLVIPLQPDSVLVQTIPDSSFESRIVSTVDSDTLRFRLQQRPEEEDYNRMFEDAKGVAIPILDLSDPLNIRDLAGNPAFPIAPNLAVEPDTIIIDRDGISDSLLTKITEGLKLIASTDTVKEEGTHLRVLDRRRGKMTVRAKGVPDTAAITRVNLTFRSTKDTPKLWGRWRLASERNSGLEMRSFETGGGMTTLLQWENGQENVDATRAESQRGRSKLAKTSSLQRVRKATQRENADTTSIHTKWDDTDDVVASITVFNRVFDPADPANFYKTMTFNIILDNTPPSIENLRPRRGEKVSPQPEISAFVEDTTAGVDRDRVGLKLVRIDSGDTTEVRLSVPPGTSKLAPKNNLVISPMVFIAYIPQRLKDQNTGGLIGGEYQATLTIFDRAGNHTDTTETFQVVSGTIIDLINYPNPFDYGENNGEEGTIIKYVLGQAFSTVGINIFDVSGALVKRFRMGDLGTDAGEQGEHKVKWDGKTDFGEMLANGVYYCELVVESKDGKEKRDYTKMAVLWGYGK